MTKRKYILRDLIYSHNDTITHYSNIIVHISLHRMILHARSLLQVFDFLKKNILIKIPKVTLPRGGEPSTKLCTSRMLITLKEPVTWPLRKLDSGGGGDGERWRVRGRKMSTMEVQEKRVEVR